MRTIIFAIIALLSVCASAQIGEKENYLLPELSRRTETFYDHVERLLFKPLEERGITIIRSENTLNAYSKSVSLDIPMQEPPHVDCDERGKIIRVDTTQLERYKKYYEIRGLLFRALDDLKSEASEVYWWSKGPDDSLLVSIAWDDPDMDQHRTYTNADGQRDLYGPTCLRVNNYSISGNGNVPKSSQYTHVFFQCMIDTAVAGTEPFDAQAFRQHVSPALNHPSIEHHSFDYHYTREFVRNESYRGFKNISTHIIRDSRRPPQSDITGEVYIIPRNIADTIHAQFLATMQTYLDAHHEQTFSTNTNKWRLSTGQVLSGLPSLREERPSSPEQTDFMVFTGCLTDNGNLIILFATTNGEMVLPKKYWNVKTAHNEKVEYINHPYLSPQEEKDRELGPIYDNPQTPPEFPGGMQKLTEYIITNLRYPTAGIENEVLADMVVNFVVEKDGSINQKNITVSDIKIYYKDSTKGDIDIRRPHDKEIHSAFLSEAMRVVLEMPRWTPGKHKGKKVRTRMSLPINFRLV